MTTEQDAVCIIGLTLLARTLSNLKAVVALTKGGSIVEAKVIARCCLENSYWVGALSVTFLFHSPSNATQRSCHCSAPAKYEVAVHRPSSPSDMSKASFQFFIMRSTSWRYSSWRTRRIQDWLGHRPIAHAMRYTQLSAAPFKDFWRR